MLVCAFAGRVVENRWEFTIGHDFLQLNVCFVTRSITVRSPYIHVLILYGEMSIPRSRQILSVPYSLSRNLPQAVQWLVTSAL